MHLRRKAFNKNFPLQNKRALEVRLKALNKCFSQRAFIFKKCTMLKTFKKTKFVSASTEEQKPNKNKSNVDIHFIHESS